MPKTATATVGKDTITYGEWLAVKDLRIDPAYQRVRPEEDPEVHHIVEHYNLHQFKPLDVSRRAQTNDFFAIDGGGRLAVARLRGDKIVPCTVHWDLTQVEEAWLFYALN